MTNGLLGSETELAFQKFLLFAGSSALVGKERLEVCRRKAKSDGTKWAIPNSSNKGKVLALERSRNTPLPSKGQCESRNNPVWRVLLAQVVLMPGTR